MHLQNVFFCFLNMFHVKVLVDTVYPVSIYIQHIYRKCIKLDLETFHKLNLMKQNKTLPELQISFIEVQSTDGTQLEGKQGF